MNWLKSMLGGDSKNPEFNDSTADDRIVENFNHNELANAVLASIDKTEKLEIESNMMALVDVDREKHVTGLSDSNLAHLLTELSLYDKDKSVVLDYAEVFPKSLESVQKNRAKVEKEVLSLIPKHNLSKKANALNIWSVVNDHGTENIVRMIGDPFSGISDAAATAFSLLSDLGITRLGDKVESFSVEGEKDGTEGKVLAFSASNTSNRCLLVKFANDSYWVNTNQLKKVAMNELPVTPESSNLPDCPHCKGLGYHVDKSHTCEVCNGTGKMSEPTPSLEAKPGPMVAPGMEENINADKSLKASFSSLFKKKTLTANEVVILREAPASEVNPKCNPMRENPMDVPKVHTSKPGEIALLNEPINEYTFMGEPQLKDNPEDKIPAVYRNPDTVPNPTKTKDFGHFQNHAAQEERTLITFNPEKVKEYNKRDVFCGEGLVSSLSKGGEEESPMGYMVELTAGDPNSVVYVHRNDVINVEKQAAYTSYIDPQTKTVVQPETVGITPGDNSPESVMTKDQKKLVKVNTDEPIIQ